MKDVAFRIKVQTFLPSNTFSNFFFFFCLILLPFRMNVGLPKMSALLLRSKHIGINTGSSSVEDEESTPRRVSKSSEAQPTYAKKLSLCKVDSLPLSRSMSTMHAVQPPAPLTADAFQSFEELTTEVRRYNSCPDLTYWRPHDDMLELDEDRDGEEDDDAEEVAHVDPEQKKMEVLELKRISAKINKKMMKYLHKAKR